MGRPRTEEYWIRPINYLAENDKKLGPKAIHAILEKSATDAGQSHRLKSMPSLRTIARRKQEYLDRASEEERQRNRHVHWPDDMGLVLPWEAGPAVLELLKWRRDHWLARPAVTEAYWFWRVTAVVPAANFDYRLKAARILGRDDGQMKRAVELWLVYGGPFAGPDRVVYEDRLRGTPEFPGDVEIDIEGKDIIDAIYEGMAKGGQW
ncbi:MAG: hypothetical protein ABSG55_00855 [Dehalococcoidia bacterium]|jgi:hypothetical protein